MLLNDHLKILPLDSLRISGCTLDYTELLTTISAFNLFLMSFLLIFSVVLEVMKLHSFERSLEPLIRRVVSLFCYELFAAMDSVSI